MGLLLDVFRDRREGALEIGGSNPICREQGPRVGVQAAPHLDTHNAVRIQVMSLLIPLDRDTEIRAVPSVDLAGREPRTIKEDLRPYHPRLSSTRPDLAGI